MIQLSLRRFVCCLFLIACLGPGAQHTAAQQARPNLVFILADDLGYGDPGFMGGQNAQTPHLDALAASGLTFTHAYANAAVCAPTRAALLSGMYAARTGVYVVGGGGKGRGRRGGDDTPAAPSTQALITPTNVSSLDSDVVTLAEALSGAGYATGHVGKWHLGSPTGATGPEANGFDFTVGAARGGATKTYFAPWGLAGLDHAKEGDYLTNRLTDEAIGFVKAHAKEPFFLYVSQYAVHTPIEPDPAVLARVKARAPQLSDNDADYAALFESFDAGVGRLLDAIDTAGVADNTLVVFASDNGGSRRLADMGGLKGYKGSLDEGGIRVPCTVRWPGVVTPGRTSDVPVMLLDLYPTFLELAGADAPQGQAVDGRSWVELLRTPGAAASQRLSDRPLVWYLPLYSTSPRGRVTDVPRAVIRRGPWKLSVNLESKEARLFNLVEDTGEAHDRAADQPTVVAALQRELADWQRATDAPVPTPNPAYQPGAADTNDTERSGRNRRGGDRGADRGRDRGGDRDSNRGSNRGNN